MVTVPDDEDPKKECGSQMAKATNEEKRTWGWKDDEKVGSQAWAHHGSWNAQHHESADSWSQRVTWSATLGGLELLLFSHILGIMILSQKYFSEGLKQPTRFPK